MMLFKRIKIRSYETGLYFRDGEFKGLLSEGRHWLFDPLMKMPRLPKRLITRLRIIESSVPSIKPSV